jgi:hypothetical protein
MNDQSIITGIDGNVGVWFFLFYALAVVLIILKGGFNK